MNLDIQGEDQVIAMHRVFTLQNLKYPALRIGLNFFNAADAVQLILVISLDPGFSDVGCAAVVTLVHPVQVVDIKSAHVTQNMGQKLTVRIVASKVGNNLDTRKLVAVHRKTGDLLFCQVEFQRHAVEVTVALFVILKFFESIVRQVDDQAKCLDHLLHVGNFLRHQLQAIGWPVFSDRPAPAVINQPAIGRHRNNPHLVGNRTGGELFVTHHLEVHVAQTEQKNSRQNDQKRGHRPGAELPPLLDLVFQRPTGRRACQTMQIHRLERWRITPR